MLSVYDRPTGLHERVDVPSASDRGGPQAPVSNRARQSDLDQLRTRLTRTIDEVGASDPLAHVALTRERLSDVLALVGELARRAS